MTPIVAGFKTPIFHGWEEPQAPTAPSESEGVQGTLGVGDLEVRRNDVSPDDPLERVLQRRFRLEMIP